MAKGKQQDRKTRREMKRKEGLETAEKRHREKPRTKRVSGKQRWA